MAERILLLFVLTILGGVIAGPFPEETVYKPEHCIPVTAQRQAEIREIANKISNFVDDLTLEHEYFDIRLTHFTIERYDPKESTDDVEIQVTINDCTETVTAESESGNAEGEKAGNKVQDDSKSIDETLVQPEIINLDLDEQGNEVVQFVQKRRGKKRPFVVYIQPGSTASQYSQQYLFLRR